jgi:hypothetical protein
VRLGARWSRAGKQAHQATADMKPREQQSRFEKLSVQAVKRGRGTAAGRGPPARPPAWAQGWAVVRPCHAVDHLECRCC